MYFFHNSPALAIREGRWKLLCFPDGSGTELYDVVAHPTETNNLANEQPDVVSRLKKKLLAWKATLPTSPAKFVATKKEYPWPKPLPMSSEQHSSDRTTATR